MGLSELTRRKKLLASILFTSFLTGTVHAGTGDPPVIMLPSAKTAKNGGVMQVQATAPTVPGAAPVAPKLEFLPPPTAEPATAKPMTIVPLAAPPLITVPDIKPATPTVPTEPVVKKDEKEVAPAPRPETKVATKPEVLPLPTPADLIGGGSPTPGMPAPKEVPSLKATTILPVADTKKSDVPPVIEKITDYAKATDVKALMEEIAGLRKDVNTLNAKPIAEAVKPADVKALKDEVEALKKVVTTLAAKPSEVEGIKKDVAALLAKPSEVEGLKKDVAAILAKPSDVDGLKKDVAALLAKQGDVATAKDNKAVKDEIDTLRKDVQLLSAFLHESIDGKTVKGITSDGVVARLKKMDDNLESLTKKVQSLDKKMNETRTTAASPVTPNAMPSTAVTPLPAIRGTVRVVNEYPVEIAIVINGTQHRIDSGTRLDVPVPAGMFKYQLLVSGGELTDRSIKENEIVTLTIR
ncbi:hypothetical protein BH11PLA2_BH11PLA2_24320 [soil metagenome]